jgi:hypothetical protein
MRMISVVLLAVVGTLALVGSIASASLAYRGGRENIGPMSITELAGERPQVMAALRGRRATAASYSGAFSALFLLVVLFPYRRGDVWAWWALLASSAVLLIMSVLRIPFLHLTAGAETSGIFFGMTLVGLLLDVRRLGRRVPA